MKRRTHDRLLLSIVAGLVVAAGCPSLGDGAARSACRALAERLAARELHASERTQDVDLAEARDAARREFVDTCVALNQIQLVGSHNSYHRVSEPVLREFVRQQNVEVWVGWGYDHEPLEVQLERLGVRQFEFDVFRDPEGGRFADPAGNRLAGLPPPDVPEMLEPGMKVFHVQDLDFHSSCPTLRGCLEILRTWSDHNRAHLPIAILLELKSDTPPGVGYAATPALPWTEESLDELDALLRDVFPRERILTPDEVRGKRASLEEAVLTDGWPLLGEVRGRTLFLLDNEGAERGLYLQGHPGLEGRVAFVPSSPGQAEAAFIKANAPSNRVEEIQDLVRRGYVIRTRADADTLEAARKPRRPPRRRTAKRRPMGLDRLPRTGARDRHALPDAHAGRARRPLQSDQRAEPVPGRGAGRPLGNLCTGVARGVERARVGAQRFLGS